MERSPGDEYHSQAGGELQSSCYILMLIPFDQNLKYYHFQEEGYRMVDLISVPSINLYFQIILLALIFLGVKLAKDKAFLVHGKLMTGLIVFNVVMIFLVMHYSLLTQTQTPIGKPLNVGTAITLTHAFFGSLAQIIGILLVIKKFGFVKLWMRIVLFNWTIALLLGIAFYIYYYLL